ncbi:excinuclease ABC subunit UvrB [Patescibacteria group bacterium]
MPLKLETKLKPQGDQPDAIKQIVSGLKKNMREQTILGVTGSGKTFAMANIIAKTNRPALIIAPNKTLAAQLASEFQQLFPSAAVHYFVSYYDYYQPEAYVPRTDTYIAKETSINDEIDRLRHAATSSLVTRKDVIIVASVSCIYGIGRPEMYAELSFTLKHGQKISRNDFLSKLIEIQYNRNDIDFQRSTFRVRGDLVEIYPPFEDEVVRVSFFGDEIEKIQKLDGLTGEVLGDMDDVIFFPASHFSTPKEEIKRATKEIAADLKKEVAEFKAQNKLVEAQRLEERVRYDLESLKEFGFVSGIENYSRYIEGRKPGEPASTLIDYFPDDFLCFIDESHITVPQIGAMYAGDHSRKKMLVDYGFRLKAAYDNRPLQYKEFDERMNQLVYVSATPRAHERERSKQIVELVVRPTGLLDPSIEIRPIDGQIDDLLEEIQKRTKDGQRTLVTTLTKRMSEDLAEYFKEAGVKVAYLHSEIDTFDRLEILRDLRAGVYDVLVGINLLREGLDLPEVSLVAILDADKEGFLRNEISLIQTMGRAARHADGHVILYADKTTQSMRIAIKETERRRTKQEAYNKKHGITPTTIEKNISEDRLAGAKREWPVEKIEIDKIPEEEISRIVSELEAKMDIAARNLEFEKAAELRDQIEDLKK